MKRLTVIIWLGCIFSLYGAQLGIVVPAYFSPGPLWSSMDWAAERVPLIAIMNPNSGPGTARNTQYVAAIKNLRTAGGRVIGYVSTSYAKRSAEVVKAEVEHYFSWYEVDGIFLDEFTNDSNANHLTYYAELYQYIKTKGTNLLVIGNPGTNTREAYLTRSCADALVTFENGAGYSNYVADGWVTKYPARRLCHLVYAVPSATTMSNFVNLAVARNSGWIYVTSDGGANPWDTLPLYWTNEVNYIRALNNSAPAASLRARIKAGTWTRMPMLMR